MIRRINRLISALIVVALALWVVVLNRDSVSVFYSATGSVTAGLGLILIVTFVFGVLLTTLIAAVFGFFAHLRESKLRKRDADRALFYSGLVEARGFISTKDLRKASAKLQQLSRKDSELLIVRLEMAKVALELGELEEGTRLVEEVRTKYPDCMEALVLSVELGRKKGNLTLALDGAKRAAAEAPSEYTLSLVRDLAAELKDFETALVFHRQLQSQFGNTELQERINVSLQAQAIAADKSLSPEARDQKLLALARSSGAGIEVFNLLESYAATTNDYSDLGALAARAATNNSSLPLFVVATKSWLKAGQPDRAIATLRTAAKELTGNAQYQAHIALAAVLMDLSKVSEASEVLRTIESKPGEAPEELRHQIALLKAAVASAGNDTRAVHAALRESVRLALHIG